MRSWVIVCVTICLLATLISGCSFGSNKVIKESERSAALKVMYYNEESFYQDYGMLFSSIYPDINIEVVSSNTLYTTYMDQNDLNYTKAVDAFLEQEQPDIILLDDRSIVPSLIKKGKLYELDSLVAEKSYNAEGFIPGTIDSMKELGSGNIYTIPTSYRTQVLYYNKDIFDKYSISYPTDKMTWEQVINLANQFPSTGSPSERIFGLRMGWSKDLSEVVNELAVAQGLNFFNAETLKMTINTPAWTSTVEQALEVMKSDALFYDDMIYSEDNMDTNGGFLITDPFISGQLAMKFESNYYLSTLEEVQSNTLHYPNQNVPRWDIVTAPVSSQQPDSSNYSHYSSFVAINADSPNIDAALKYVSYITGEDYARVTSNLRYSKESLRVKYIHKDTERNYAALYKLMSGTADPMSAFINVPQRFLVEFTVAFQDIFNKLADGKGTIEQSLAQLQILGDELLVTEKMTSEEFDNYLDESNAPSFIIP